MKYFLGVVVLAVVVLAALLYVPVDNGRPMLDPDGVKEVLDESVRAVTTEDSNWVEDDGKAMLYRWRDSSGNWQYGDTPPPGVAAEPMEKKEVRTVSGHEPLDQAVPDEADNPGTPMEAK